jgi:transcriptional regulator with XRE-family HTH domain
MNTRLKIAREHRKLSQLKVAELIGISSSAYSKLEKGVNNPADRTVTLFCQQLSISETWLRTGEGSMELPAPQSVVDQMARDYDLSPGKVMLLRSVARAFNELDEFTFNRIMDDLFAEMAARIAARNSSNSGDT